jgi:hypothetical protein
MPHKQGRQESNRRLAVKFALELFGRSDEGMHPALPLSRSLRRARLQIVSSGKCFAPSDLSDRPVPRSWNG